MKSLEFHAIRPVGLILQSPRREAFARPHVTEDGSPVALSVVPSIGRDQVISAQGGENANLLHWRARTYGYALIGNLSLDTMKDLADKIAPRLSPAT